MKKSSVPRKAAVRTTARVSQRRKPGEPGRKPPEGEEVSRRVGAGERERGRLGGRSHSALSIHLIIEPGRGDNSIIEQDAFHTLFGVRNASHLGRGI